MRNLLGDILRYTAESVDFFSRGKIFEDVEMAESIKAVRIMLEQGNIQFERTLEAMAKTSAHCVLEHLVAQTSAEPYDDHRGKSLGDVMGKMNQKTVVYVLRYSPHSFTCFRTGTSEV